MTSLFLQKQRCHISTCNFFLSRYTSRPHSSSLPVFRFTSPIHDITAYPVSPAATTCQLNPLRLFSIPHKFLDVRHFSKMYIHHVDLRHDLKINSSTINWSLHLPTSAARVLRRRCSYKINDAIVDGSHAVNTCYMYCHYYVRGFARMCLYQKGLRRVGLALQIYSACR